MQMTYEQAMRPGLMLAFASRSRSGYMMRSEKRGGPYGNGSNRRPPKRRAGFVYIFLTLLLCLILWPVGMVMLWRKKVRLQAGTKLLISLLTLCLSVFLIVFALTVPVSNPEYTAFQDRANDWLTQAETSLAAAGEAAYKKGTETWQIMSDFSEAGYEYAMLEAADLLDAGVEKAGQAREAIEGLIHRKDEPEKPAEPDQTKLPEDTGAPSETGEPEGSGAEATEDPQDAVEETSGPEPDDGIDIRLPEATPDSQSAQALSAGVLHADGSFTPEAAETPEPETWTLAEDVTPIPTEAPTEEPVEEPTEEPVEEPTEEPVEEPTEEPAEEPVEEPTEEPVEEPVEEPTEEPVEEPTEEPIEEPTEEPTVEPTEEPTVEPTEEPVVEPTEEPIVEPTEEPTEAPVDDTGIMVPVEPTSEADSQVIFPLVTSEASYQVKPAGEATVYYFENGRGFHAHADSHNLVDTPAHTLAEAFASGKTPCSSCKMPDQSLLEEPYVAWVDEDKKIHTTDECAAFQGDWQLIPLFDAVEAGYSRCGQCGADVYAEAIFPSPTPTPAPEVVTPSVALKSAGEIKVYYFDVSRSYHVAPDCKGMSNAPEHTLAEAVADGKHVCGNCNPVSSELIGLPMLWLDEKGLCHTSDECASFSGQYRLVNREDALEQGLAACADCGATEYMIPNTILAE